MVKSFEPKELDFFWKISESVVSGRYLKEILHLIVTMTAEVMGSKICSILLLDEKSQELAIEATQALSADYIKKPNIKVGESVSGNAVKTGKPIAILDITQDKQYRFPDIARREKIVSMLCVPMMLRSRGIGVINVYTTEPRPFDEREIKLLQAVANQAAVAIENTKLQEEALAARKTLETTKLVNRAKAALIKTMHLSEDEAHKLLLRSSRNNRKSMREVAEAVLLAFSGGLKSPL
jgi:signal transduction protein with GAF and PtsI domain